MIEPERWGKKGENSKKQKKATASRGKSRRVAYVWAEGDPSRQAKEGWEAGKRGWQRGKGLNHSGGSRMIGGGFANGLTGEGGPTELGGKKGGQFL